MAIKRFVLISGALLILMGTSPADGFERPLTKMQEYRFKEKISRQQIAKLEEQLESRISLGKSALILDELGKRKESKVRNLLETFINKMGLKLQESHGKDPKSGMLRARALVNLARVKAGEQDPQKYLLELERLLRKGDKYTQEAVAIDLGENISSKQARDLLWKYENKRNISHMVKVERLRIDYWQLSNEGFVEAILESAQEQIRRGDTQLVAERTILVQRGMYETLLPSSLEEEINKPSSDSQDYLKFLKDVHRRLEVCEDRYHPGSSALLDLYGKRDRKALNALREVYTDASLDWHYREKAFELYLTIEMEQSGLNSSEAALKYLLSNLKSTGHGHSTDWKNNNKTLEAIKNAGTVRKLIKYGKPALPFIDQELSKVSPAKERRRYEALSYVKKRIEDSLGSKEYSM